MEKSIIYVRVFYNDDWIPNEELSTGSVFAIGKVSHLSDNRPTNDPFLLDHLFQDLEITPPISVFTLWDELERTIPVRPPTVNKNTKPRAQ